MNEDPTGGPSLQNSPSVTQAQRCYLASEPNFTTSQCVYKVRTLRARIQIGYKGVQRSVPTSDARRGAAVILTSDAGFVRPCPRSWQELPSTPNTLRRLARSKYLRGTLPAALSLRWIMAHTHRRRTVGAREEWVDAPTLRSCSGRGRRSVGAINDQAEM